MILYEVTIQVNALCIKMLLDDVPTLGRICECISIMFADNTEIETGVISLLLSIGDDEDRHNTKFLAGDEIRFTEDDKVIGHMDIQTRTVFSAS